MPSMFDNVNLDDPQALINAALGGPTDEEKKQAQAMGMLTAGLGILSTPRTPGMGPFTPIFQGAAPGINAYASSLKDSETQRKQGIQDALALKKLTQNTTNAKNYGDVFSSDKPDYLAGARTAAKAGDLQMLDHFLTLHEKTQAQADKPPVFIPPNATNMWTPNSGVVPIPGATGKPDKLSPEALIAIESGMVPGTPEFTNYMKRVAERKVAPTYAQSAQANPLTDDAIDMGAEELFRTGKMPQLGYQSTPARMAIVNKAAAKAKELGISFGDVLAGRAGYLADTKALTDRTKFVATSDQFVNNMQQQIQLVKGLMEKGAGTSAGPVLNRWIQAGRKATGDPDVSALDTAIRGLAREHQRIVTGVTSQAQLHTSSQQTGDELLNIAQTEPQILAVMGVMGEEAHNANVSGHMELNDLQGRLRSFGGLIPGTATPAPGVQPGAAPVAAPTASVAAPAAPTAPGGRYAGPPTGIVDQMGYEYLPDEKTKTGRRFTQQNGKWVQVL